MAYLIEYADGSMWIKSEIVNHSWGVTAQRHLAMQFETKEQAKEQIRVMGLTSSWSAEARHVPS